MKKIKNVVLAVAVAAVFISLAAGCIPPPGGPGHFGPGPNPLFFPPPPPHHW